MDVKGNCLTFYRHLALEEYSVVFCIKRATGSERERDMEERRYGGLEGVKSYHKFQMKPWLENNCNYSALFN